MGKMREAPPPAMVLTSCDERQLEKKATTVKGNPILNLDARHWQYRAEGNANLVLSLADTKQVLRLKKSDKLERLDVNKNFKFINEVVHYIRQISTQFGPCFTIDPTLVILMLQDMDAFNKKLNISRPIDRLEKEIRYPFGIIYPDVTFLPKSLSDHSSSNSHTGDVAEPALATTICVEIKPKQGWRFNETEDDLGHFSQLFGVEEEKLATCRYCAMQYLKLEKSKINRISRYCPIDLFSGFSDRMLRAIRHLIDCPQNNLRVFRDGAQIFGNNYGPDQLDSALVDIFGTGDKNRNLHQFADLLVNILLKDFSGEEMRRTEGCLPENSILGEVLRVQKCVQRFFLGIKGADNLTESDVRNWVRESPDAVNLDQYCFGATALDCSLMITFKKCSPEEANNPFSVHHNGTDFLSKIAIMDLDPKPFSHAVKYVDQTRASYQALIS